MNPEKRPRRLVAAIPGLLAVILALAVPTGGCDKEKVCDVVSTVLTTARLALPALKQIVALLTPLERDLLDNGSAVLLNGAGAAVSAACKGGTPDAKEIEEATKAAIDLLELARKHPAEPGARALGGGPTQAEVDDALAKAHLLAAGCARERARGLR